MDGGEDGGWAGGRSFFSARPLPPPSCSPAALSRHRARVRGGRVAGRGRGRSGQGSGWLPGPGAAWPCPRAGTEAAECPGGLFAGVKGGHGAAHPSQGPPAFADVPSCVALLFAPPPRCVYHGSEWHLVWLAVLRWLLEAQRLSFSVRLAWRQRGVTSVRKHEPRFQTRRLDLRQDERLPPLAGQGKAPSPPSASLSVGCALTPVLSSALSFASREGGRGCVPGV